MTLDRLSVGESARIVETGGTGSLRKHFLDMGLIPGAEVTLVKLAPMGDPMEIRIHGYSLTLRRDDASRIAVEKTETEAAWENAEEEEATDHPGYGEGGRFHQKSDGNPLPEGEKITFVLAGNQNCGKTTLFNQLTGSNQHVGNFPGVTVEGKVGTIRGTDAAVTDLPGIYSLSPYTAEEIVSRDSIIDGRPKGIINIVDATNIERNLYLTLQLMELDVPMVLALNMMDEVKGNGGSIRINEMERILGIPVVPIAANRNEGVQELVEHAMHVAYYQEKPGRKDFCSKEDRGGAVHRAIHAVMHLVEDHAEREHLPLRFAASKLIEGDTLVEERLALTESEKHMLSHIVEEMEREGGLDREAAIADMRFSFIQDLARRTVVKSGESREQRRSQRIDDVLTGRYTAFPCFALIMAAVFYLTFVLAGPFLQDILDSWITALSDIVAAAMERGGVNSVVTSLVTDGIFQGVGSVVSFLPIIVLLFFFLSLLEDTGYMARVAFLTDKALRKLGLSGRSIVPMLIGFGCTVPAVMASRTLPSERDRKLTVLLTPFMSCTAKLPVYVFFAYTFFPSCPALVTVAVYLAGIVMAVIVALFGKNTVFKGEAVPFVMELPPYRLPGLKNVGRLLWDKAKDFLERAFTIIFMASILIWFLQAFDLRLNYVEGGKDSILSVVAGVLSPLFSFHGFGDWRVVTALVAGFIAKESVVSTLSVLFSGAAITAAISTSAAASLLTFSLLYTPCIAAVSAIKRELGTKWALGIVLFQCALAWAVSLIVRFLFLLF